MTSSKIKGVYVTKFGKTLHMGFFFSENGVWYIIMVDKLYHRAKSQTAHFGEGEKLQHLRSCHTLHNREITV